MSTPLRPSPIGLSRLGGLVLVAHLLLAALLGVSLWGADRSVDKRRPIPVYRLDVNTAGSESLQLLPCVGSSLAQRMIDHRAQRPFADLADLRSVRGIGEELSARMAAHVRFGAGRGG